MLRKICSVVLLGVLVACNSAPVKTTKKEPVQRTIEKPLGISLIVLGTVQDAGSPQIACTKKCCTDLKGEDKKRMVSCLGILDPLNGKRYLLDATPDLVAQNEILNEITLSSGLPDGLFLTHGHIGHYTGLMYLGKESINSEKTPVYAMPRMSEFLRLNGPWSQLVNNGNIDLIRLKNRDTVILSEELKIIPFLVPHRDEYSETVGYKIMGPKKNVLFIPDIDKWNKWELDILEELSSVDLAFIDGTFFDGEEINNRDIAEIPHPFIIESMELFDELSQEEKNKVNFIHLNHTNPALNSKSSAYSSIRSKGYHIAEMRSIHPLY